MIFDFVMTFCFLLVAVLLFDRWINHNKRSRVKSSGVTPDPQTDTIHVISAMENTLIDEFNVSFPESLRIERPSGSSRYLQDYDPEYFQLLKGLKTLSQMQYDLSIKQAELVKRCLQMNEVSAMFREDKEKVLEPQDIKLHTQYQQTMEKAESDYSYSFRHQSIYEKKLKALKTSNNHQEDGATEMEVVFQNEIDKYKQQNLEAFLRQDDANIVLQDFRLTLLNKLVDPSEINDETLDAQLGDFSRYSELVYNP